MSDEVRVWPDGSTTTRAEAEANGWPWREVSMYTEPVIPDEPYDHGGWEDR